MNRSARFAVGGAGVRLFWTASPYIASVISHAGAFKVSAISRFSFDLDAEMNLVWAALDEPASVQRLNIDPEDFYDPALACLFQEAMRLHALGRARPLLWIGSEFPLSHWFWKGPDPTGPDLMWMLFSRHDSSAPPDLELDAQQVASLAQARRA